MKNNNKGQITLGTLPNTILTLVFIGAIAIGGFLALSSLATGTACPSLYQYNEGSNTCTLISNSSITSALTNSGNATVSIEEGMSNVFDQMSTIGTLIGVGILLTVVVLGFGAARRGGLI